jgi:hypothetical protein
MLLLGYLASLLSIFVVSAAMFSAILTGTVANKAPDHSYRSDVVPLSRHEAHKHPVGSKVSRAIAKGKAKSVVAATRHVTEIASGQEVRLPERWPKIGVQLGADVR